MKRIYNIMVVATAVAATIFYLPAIGSQTKKSVRQEVKRYREFLEILGKNYIDTLDYTALTERAINGVLDGCDPHSRYLPKQGGISLRSEIESAPIKQAYMIDENTLCIDVTLFSRNTSEMILFKYHEMGSPPTLLLDLRGNKGGLVEEAIKTAELFLNKNDVILTRKGRTIPSESFKARKDGELQDIELLIAIDRRSASASEIVVGALKDHGRAEIVGERSYGKGLIMKQYYMHDSTSVLIAIAHYLTPDSIYIQSPYMGRSVDESLGGITPTIEYEFKKMIDIEDVESIRKKAGKK